MLDIGSAGRNLLETSHAGDFRIDVFYGGKQTYSDLPFDRTQSSLSFDLTAQVPGSGTVIVPTLGTSLRPRQLTDTLAAFGQELQISYQSADGSLNIMLGTFRITDVPSSQEFKRRNPFVTLGSYTELTLGDRLDFLAHDTYLNVTTPQSASAWTEIQSITPIPLVKSLPDATVPSTLVYQDKYDAVQQLMALMGGEPVVTREGALTAVTSNVWTLAQQPVTTVNGTVTRQDGMSNGIYNVVVVTSPNVANAVGLAQVTNGPLSVNGPLGRRVYNATDSLSTTQDGLNATAATYLSRLSSLMTQQVTVTCLPRFDLDLGDLIAVYDPNTDETIVGGVVAISYSLDPTQLMTLTLTEQVAR